MRKISATDLTTEVYNINLGSIDGDITDIETDGAGNVYLAGYTTNAALTGGAATSVNGHAGGSDVFVLKISDAGASGTADTLTYVGGASTDKINDLTFANGNIYVAGSSGGSVNGEVQSGIVDSFAASLNSTTLAVNYVEQFGQSLGSAGANGVAFVCAPTTGNTRPPNNVFNAESVVHFDLITFPIIYVRLLLVYSKMTACFV